jgi:hypothetical protein
MGLTRWARDSRPGCADCEAVDVARLRWQDGLEDLKLAREVARDPLFKGEWNDPRAVQSNLTPGGWAIRPWRELLGRRSSGWRPRCQVPGNFLLSDFATVVATQ